MRPPCARCLDVESMENANVCADCYEALVLAWSTLYLWLRLGKLR